MEEQNYLEQLKNNLRQLKSKQKELNKFVLILFIVGIISFIIVMLLLPRAMFDSFFGSVDPIFSAFSWIMILSALGIGIIVVYKIVLSYKISFTEEDLKNFEKSEDKKIILKEISKKIETKQIKKIERKEKGPSLVIPLLVIGIMILRFLIAAIDYYN